MDSGISDESYQEQILPHVSRTFALTIPQLPAALRLAVTNAYLLCRIADTIEDEPALSPAETLAFLERFKAVVAGRGEPALLASEVDRRLSERTLPTRARSDQEHGARPQRDGILDRAAAGGDSALRRPDVLRNAAISINGQPARPRRAAPTSTTTAITSPAWSARCSRSCFASIPRACSAASGRTAAPRRLLRAGLADDEYSQGRLGGSQPRGVLAAAGGLYAPWRRSGAALAGAPRSRASMPGCAS